MKMNEIRRNINTITFLIGSLGGGGAERVTIALGDYFSKKGYNIFFIVFSKDNNNYQVNSRINVCYLPDKTGKKRDIYYRIVELKRMLKNQNPDYIISLGLGYQYIAISNLFSKYKVVLSERNAPQYFYKWHQLLCVKYCYRRAYKVVFQTNEAKDFFGKIAKGKSKVIANPLTNTLPEPFKGKREKKLVAVNRLSKQKNLHMLFKAFRIVLTKFPDYILEIYGKGELENELKDYAFKLGISENIRFMGQKKNVHNYILNAYMFVSSSDYEGMSNSMLEAMAIGLPVVCTDCPIGGARMIIKNGVNGILTPVKDEKAFAKAILELIEDPSKAEKLGENAHKICDELNVDKIAEEWEKVLNT